MPNSSLGRIKRGTPKLKHVPAHYVLPVDDSNIQTAHHRDQDLQSVKTSEESRSEQTH